MGTFLLCSASGAPGVTVTALGLALTWPGDVLLVDADRTPSQAILAGYLRGAAAHSGGLPGILQAHRERRPISDALLSESMQLPEPPDRRPALERERGTERRFLPGFVHLGTIEVFGGVWRELGLAIQAAPYDAIVDAGRIGSRGLPGDLVETASRVGVVCRSSLTSLAALRLYLGPLLEQVPAEQVGLVIVGPGRPYSAKEAAEQFGVSVLAEIAWDASGASDLADGQPLSKRWRQGRLASSYAAAARSLTALHETERLRIGAPS